MELNRLRSLDLSDISQSSVEKLKSKVIVGVDSISKPLKVDKIESQSQVQSSFASGLISNVRQISNALNIQSTVSKQLDITNEIKQAINAVTSNSSKSLDDIQPKIKKLMDDFNNYSSNMSTSIGAMANNSTDEQSRIYFDGILGAKPLSSEEIFAEVDSQRQRLQNINKTANEEVINNIEKSKNMFTTEKKTLETQQPQIKSINFAVESSNFEAKKLQNVQGSVVDTQANASTKQNIKLLAS